MKMIFGTGESAAVRSMCGRLSETKEDSGAVLMNSARRLVDSGRENWKRAEVAWVMLRSVRKVGSDWVSRIGGEGDGDGCCWDVAE